MLISTMKVKIKINSQLLNSIQAKLLLKWLNYDKSASIFYFLQYADIESVYKKFLHVASYFTIW